MVDRKEYDRQRAAKLYNEFRRRRQNVEDSLGGECFLCYKQESGMHLHHVMYDDVESDYPKHSKNMAVRLKRLEEAEQHPERFRLLCLDCHNTVTALLRKTIDLDRLKSLL